MTEPVVLSFQDLWKHEKELLGGEWIDSGDSTPMVWFPRSADGGKLLVSALEVTEHFFQTYGGIWTGCMKMDKSAECRGALAGELCSSD
jgi:hypothetical protein